MEIKLCFRVVNSIGKKLFHIEDQVQFIALPGHINVICHINVIWIESREIWNNFAIS